MHVSEMLLPEFDTEMKSTRKMLERVPEGKNDYKPHEKSMALGRLAGHVAQLPEFAIRIIELPSLDFSKSDMKPLVLESRKQLLDAFDSLTQRARAAIAKASDKDWEHRWKLSFQGQKIAEDSRLQMYRAMFLNPHIHPMRVEKKYLFSFAGGSTSILRKKLYKVTYARPDVLVENTSTYWHWDVSQPGREDRQKKYAETIASSHFVLCPRGGSAGGLRLYEVMQMGVAPVILSDRLQLPEGPDWQSFAIRVPERKIKQLDTILGRHLAESAERGRLAREAYEEWFAPPVVFNNVIAACIRIRSRRRVPERWIHPFWGYMLWRRRILDGARDILKSAILRMYRRMGKRFAYDLNRP